MTFPDISKFSFKEAFNNNSGKTEMALICALLVITTGCIGFIWALAVKYEISLNASIVFVTLGSGLLGIRRFTNEKGITILGDDGKLVTTNTPDTTQTINQ